MYVLCFLILILFISRWLLWSVFRWSLSLLSSQWHHGFQCMLCLHSGFGLCGDRVTCLYFSHFLQAHCLFWGLHCMRYDYLSTGETSRIFHSHTGSNHGGIASIPPQSRIQSRQATTERTVPQPSGAKGCQQCIPRRNRGSMRQERVETFQFVHKPQVTYLFLVAVICLVPMLPLRVPQHLSQDATCRLGGKKSVFTWWAELETWGSSRWGRLGTRTRGVGRSRRDEEGIWVFPSIVATLHMVSSQRRCIEPSVPAVRVINWCREAVLEQEAHEA